MSNQEKTTQNPLSLGNDALEKSNYQQAIAFYAQAIIQQPELLKIIFANLEYAKNKYKQSRESIENINVAVCGWELAHNAAGRVYTLATIYESFANVEIIGSIFPRQGQEVWEPIRDTKIAKHTFVVEDESKFIEQAIKLVSRHPYDIVHLSKPRAPNIFFGILYKLFWGSKVLLDIDDEELAFVGAETPFSIYDFLNYIQGRVATPKLTGLPGKNWTRLAVCLGKEFDGLTVCNTALQRRYGGEIIRHARDKNLFNSTIKYKQQKRKKYNVPEEAKVVLFFGTPRAHKGLIETAKAIASMNRMDVIYCIVGSFPDENLKKKLLEIKGCNYIFLPNQPVSKTPEILAIADCCVMLQNEASTISHFQTPAKVSDAISMGVPVLITKTESTADLKNISGINFITDESLEKQLAEIINKGASYQDNTNTHILSLPHNANNLKKYIENTNEKTDTESKIQFLITNLILPYLYNNENYKLNLETENKLNTQNSSVENIIIPENINHHPDLFAIKSSQKEANSVAIVWITSTEEFNKTLEKINKLNFTFELIVLTKYDNVPSLKSNKLSSLCKKLTVIGFPERTQKTGSIVRVIQSGALWRYKTIILLDSDKKYWPKDNLIIGKAIEQFENNTDNNIGIICSKLRANNDITSEFKITNLARWYSRLHRAAPTHSVNVPTGITAVQTSILHQTIGLNLRANKFDNLSKQDDQDAYDTFLCILGLFANEGSYHITDFGKLTHLDLNKNTTKPERSIKTIAFFLPQFHIIPENDRWWGKGFTEWNNVVRATPLFKDHYQPKLPADLGFYDLRSEATQVSQAELAKKYGIHGFCYYYYYFNGKKILNEPIEQMLSSDKVDFPFCVCWANENWSRNWDGQNKHVLIEQSYSNESNKALIHEFIKMMKDKRYIRHHGKPVLIVYRIKLIPNWLETAAMWREECRKAGVGEIHLCSIRFGLEPLEGMPEEHGLDAYVLFPPQDTNFVDVRKDVKSLHPNFGGSLLSYDAVVDGDIARFQNGYPWPVHRGAMLGWDNTARRLTAARIFTGCTPMRYRTWLNEIVKQEIEHNKDKDSLLFINAWNEWAEGTTLEPDQRYGTAYLEATHSIVSPYSDKIKPPPSLQSSSYATTINNYTHKKLFTKKTEHLKGKLTYNPSKPTILVCAHISGHQTFGGERSLLDILKAFAILKLNIIVTLPSMNNKEYVESVSDNSLLVYSFPYEQWIDNRIPDPVVQQQFVKIIKNHNISIVYSNTIVLIEPALAAKSANCISIVHARELITIDDSLRKRIGLSTEIIIKTIYERYDFVIANSQATKSVFSREGKTFYVPNSVDIDCLKLENNIENRIKVGIVSSNNSKKGISDFIEVAKHCKDLSDSIDFVVIGPENTQITQWKKDIELGLLPANLKFLGYRNSPTAAIAELNILLNLSFFGESFGRTVAEAMVANRPVIAYQWGALPELINHGITGFLAPYRDTKKVSDYIRVLYKDPLLIEKMGRAGHAFAVQNFNHNKLTRCLDKAITKIINLQTSK